jgi:hypothetical protein
MRIIPGLAIAIGVLLAATPAAFAQQAGKKQQASLPRQPGMPEPMPHLVPGAVGHFPLTLTSSAAVTYQEYFAQACPLVLTVDGFGWTTHAALSTDGACPADVSKIPQDTIRAALKTCEAYSQVPPCSVIAVGRKVVWDGPITFAPGRFVPQGDDQVPVVLRRIVADTTESATSETDVGVIRFDPEGRSGVFSFQRHAELGECDGSLKAAGNGEPATVALTCTKIGEVSGTISFKPGERAGTGTAMAGKRRFTLTVLPRSDAMKNGTALYSPPPEPAAPAGKPMVKMQEGKKS